MIYWKSIQLFLWLLVLFWEEQGNEAILKEWDVLLFFFFFFSIEYIRL